MGYSGNLYAQATEVITSQGDLRRGDSSGNPERLAIGSNLTVLTSNGTTESWAAPAAGGATITIQEDHITSPISTTSTTFVDTGITATISQSSGTSYVNACLNWHVNPAQQIIYRIVEGSNNQAQQMEEERSGNTPFVATQDGVFVNASQVVKIQWKCGANTVYCDNGNGRSGIWIMEVA